jgi:hypothetical protein
MELAKATRSNGYMAHCVELLESEVEEERCLRTRAEEVQREHRSAAVAFARGVKVSKDEMIREAAGHVAAEAEVAVEALGHEQEAEWAAGKEALVAEAIVWQVDAFEQLERRKPTLAGCVQIETRPGLSPEDLNRVLSYVRVQRHEWQRLPGRRLLRNERRQVSNGRRPRALGV